MVLGYEARYTEVEGGVNLNVASWLCGVNLIEKSSWTYEADLGAGPWEENCFPDRNWGGLAPILFLTEQEADQSLNHFRMDRTVLLAF
jgi:hypothetical protein